MLTLTGATELLPQLLRKPALTAFPTTLDLRLQPSAQCHYQWPYCAQPLYATAQPVLLNVSLLCGLAAMSSVTGPPQWVPDGPDGSRLKLAFGWSKPLWPWAGWLSVSLTVDPASSEWGGEARGVIRLTVTADAGAHRGEARTLELPLLATLVPTPPRAQRLLWDQAHTVNYPPAYIPADQTASAPDSADAGGHSHPKSRGHHARHQSFLDWYGDHLHTNFRGLFNHLREKAFFVEILHAPLADFDAAYYTALLVVDSEAAFAPAEAAKLAADVRTRGLSLMVAADWDDAATRQRLRFLDDNTHRWITPVCERVPWTRATLDRF